MGSKQLVKPERIGEKVREIRRKLGITQEQIFELLTHHGAKIHVGYIARYEINERTPTMLVTLAYARAVGIPMEILVDDELDLPKKLPGKSKH
ncbi:MAG TPA: helix-turn-helix transcriptional regulator [Pyrinomonadaceae bacterium]|jgi:transcriptional regulator with XRE-family HTH domain|nr:helix-turn-helix transcriptional regulator [Pyrinomonadaceae bacterium]